MKLRLLGLCSILLFLVGCSHNVPLRHSLALTNPPNPKIQKSILVVMPEDQAQRIIRHKPDPLADTYVFVGGPSLKDTIIDVLSQVYDRVDFAYTRPQGRPMHNILVEVDYRSSLIVLNIYKGNEVRHDIVYTIYGRHKSEHFPTKVSSKDRYSGGELVAALLGGAFANIRRMKASSGAAWDQATANSVGMLLDRLVSQKY